MGGWGGRGGHSGSGGCGGGGGVGGWWGGWGGGKEELKHTDISDLMEGIYVRIEDESWVLGRVKHPRSEFSKVHVDDSDWMKRPIIPNILNNKHIVVSS